ncbi:hypothetical protein K6Y31_08585 [Motilimonas cestriensis]|uniref:Uncharacterized protein n=1 Tax=Motilimonas cestriensis TaxID=2742685 RepID=A0ABS8W7B5_9GAMM|nr:hypothetical protein [Motilimonas cestriensis]
MIDGEEVGACLDVDESLSGTASGQFSEGASLLITTAPSDGICIMHIGNGSELPWSPSPCFASVQSPTVGTCGVIDLFDGGKFKEMSCRDAFYDDTVEFSGSLFAVKNDDGNRCGGAGNFQTYVYGGPANVTGARWSEYGPDSLKCNISFNGPRPNALLGPTWVKVSVGVGIAETGDYRSPGRSARTEFFVPVNGDMREREVDLAIQSSVSNTTYNADTRSYEATITLVLTNNGSLPVESFRVSSQMPSVVHVLDISDDRCFERDSNNNSLGRLGSFVGPNLTCQGLSLAESGDALGRDVEFIDIDVRITNIAELDGDIEFEIQGVVDDTNTSDNTDITRLRIDLNQSGTLSDTQRALDALETSFNYEISSDALLDKQCDVYMNDIFDQLTLLREKRPDLFSELSFGRVTSGHYNVLTGNSQVENEGRLTAGHVGVVVYMKGTDYRRTGVVIHGTPTWSPVDLDIQSNRGRQSVGGHITSFGFAESFISFGTQGHGEYYRTPFKNFPGVPKQEEPGGCGFEGLYQDNVGEFNGGSTIRCTGSLVSNSSVDDEVRSCNITLDSTILRTESPVDIRAKNAAGAVIETSGSQITMDEYYYKRVFAWPERHDDGSYSWLISLPNSEYDVELIGNGEGSYKFTSVTFDESGEAVFDETRGLTSVGLVENFKIGDITNPASDGEAEGNASSSGGCTVGSGDKIDPLLAILALLSLLGIYRKRLLKPYKNR